MNEFADPVFVLFVVCVAVGIAFLVGRCWEPREWVPNNDTKLEGCQQSDMFRCNICTDRFSAMSPSDDHKHVRCPSCKSRDVETVK